MVCLTNNVLRKSECFECYYKSPKDVSELSREDIKNYLASYGEVNNNEKYDFGIPRLIASPIPRTKQGQEYMCGETGSVQYFGPALREKPSNSEIEEMLADIYHRAYFDGREITIDTYFNKVLVEAIDRGILKLESNDIFMADLLGLRLTRAIRERESLQKQHTTNRLIEIREMEKRARESSSKIRFR